MRNIIIIVFLIALCDSCNFLTKKENTLENDVRKDKLNKINELINKVGFVKLPYSIDLNSIQETYPVNYKLNIESSDSILIKDGLQPDIIGFLPDTSNYFGILYYVHADMTLIQLMTYSKKGVIITNKLVTECNCAIFGGEVIYCKDTTTIEENLSVKYFHESKVVVESKTRKNSYDTIYKSIERIENINKLGEITLTKSDTLIRE